MRRGPTRSEPDPAVAPRLRAGRDELVARGEVRARAFGAALARLLDEALTELFEPIEATVPLALVALGSYGRRELCPGSDVDVLLLRGEARRRTRLDVRAVAEPLWYPLWDAGFVLGHASRTVKESIDLAAGDIDTLTALLQARHVAGDDSLTTELVARVRALAQRRRDRMVLELSTASARRRVRPGLISEVLEPNLKDGAGGLRDVQSLEWVGWAIGDQGGLDALTARGYLAADDRVRLDGAAETLLDVRVELHRLTNTKSDLLVLQEQDAVAAAAGDRDADALVRRLARGGRDVAWIAADVWARLTDMIHGPAGRGSARERVLGERIVQRDGRIALIGSDAPRAFDVLEAAAAAAEHALPFERATLDHLAEMPEPTWDTWERAAFLRLLRAGEAAITVFEALDHAGVLVRLLPEWAHVRSLPQRNAYHHFTVDRHLLEAVAQCARLLDRADAPELPFDGAVVRACARPELLLLGALLHDIGKGLPGDHATTGAQIARGVAERMRLDPEGVEIVVWLVADHLRMADTATRRDLSDETTARRFVDALAGDSERLRLLYLLTIGDSLATGPSAWSAAKAALVRDLFVKAAAIIESDSAESLVESRHAALAALLGTDRCESFLARLPGGYPLAFDAETMSEHAHLADARPPVVASARASDGRIVVTTIAADRPGLLATVAGALTVAGLAVHEANLFTTTDGLALDVFRADDTFHRFGEQGEELIRGTIESALAGSLDIAAGVRERRRHYERAATAPEAAPEVIVDLEASSVATVVEVHATDRVGLLYELALTFSELSLDVTVAKVATLGDHVVDTFYVRDARGAKLADPGALAELEAALLATLRS